MQLIYGYSIQSNLMLPHKECQKGISHKDVIKGNKSHFGQ